MNYAIIENGIVSNIVVASEALADNWVASQTAAIGDHYAAGVFTRPEPATPAPTSADVDAERDRRIDAGLTFNGVQFQSRAADRENINGKALQAYMAIAAGAQPGDLRWANAEQDFAWIASDNSLIPMDAQTVIEFGNAAAAHKEAHIFAARRLKDMNQIPDDFTADSWWP
ncbi:DUF4376 domain-containing protein [Stutzerimonas kunmingensis]|uniref:DUF4376 domain-containing protein n=1 Tax=Stutzerimonas kunmingensis TaxID=1211807 RepID=UPI0028A6DDE1|nr:DUF4376 domain-containing protein [Stutzerimonas kunmingensis]